VRLVDAVGRQHMVRTTVCCPAGCKVRRKLVPAREIGSRCKPDLLPRHNQDPAVLCCGRTFTGSVPVAGCTADGWRLQITFGTLWSCSWCPRGALVVGSCVGRSLHSCKLAALLANLITASRQPLPMPRPWPFLLKAALGL
jgi:hypothetical protein